MSCMGDCELSANGSRYIECLVSNSPLPSPPPPRLPLLAYPIHISPISRLVLPHPFSSHILISLFSCLVSFSFVPLLTYADYIVLPLVSSRRVVPYICSFSSPVPPLVSAHRSSFLTASRSSLPVIRHPSFPAPVSMVCPAALAISS